MSDYSSGLRFLLAFIFSAQVDQARQKHKTDAFNSLNKIWSVIRIATDRHHPAYYYPSGALLHIRACLISKIFGKTYGQGACDS